MTVFRTTARIIAGIIGFVLLWPSAWAIIKLADLLSMPDEKIGSLLLAGSMFWVPCFIFSWFALRPPKRGLRFLIIAMVGSLSLLAWAAYLGRM